MKLIAVLLLATTACASSNDRKVAALEAKADALEAEAFAIEEAEKDASLVLTSDL